MKTQIHDIELARLQLKKMSAEIERLQANYERLAAPLFPVGTVMAIDRCGMRERCRVMTRRGSGTVVMSLDFGHERPVPLDVLLDGEVLESPEVTPGGGV